MDNVKIAKELVSIAKDLSNMKTASVSYDTRDFRTYMVGVYNMSFEEFCKMYEYIFGKQSDKGYAQEKYNKMQRNFANWFLDLDWNTINKSFEYVIDVCGGNIHV